MGKPEVPLIVLSASGGSCMFSGEFVFMHARYARQYAYAHTPPGAQRIPTLIEAD